MSQHYYRCSRCRTRNTFRKAVVDYVIPRRCRDCGHQKFYVDKERANRWRHVCRCEGAYPWPAHRPGSPMCVLNPDHLANRALRDGCDEDDIAWHGLRERVVDVCPF